MIANLIEPMANDALRTICIAYKDFVPSNFFGAGTCPCSPVAYNVFSGTLNPTHFTSSSGQVTWAPCAVERDVRSGRGSILSSAWARPPTKRIISNNSYAHDDQGDNPGQENRGLDGVLYKL